jgi:arylsulfatase A
MKILPFTLLAALFLLAGCGANSSTDRPPNIILIMTDDMGYGGASCYDNPHYRTPELDRLAADGMRLTDYHSNGTVCSPTRAALMTGRYQYRMGCHYVINADPKHPDHQRGLPAEEWTMAEALKEAGYATAIFGKWHLGYKLEFNPLRHGFDQFNGFVSGNIDAHSHYDRMVTKDWWQGEEIKDEPGYHTDLITDRTIDFIRKHQSRPFFIYVSHGAPHSPHQARGSEILRGPDKGTVPPWGEQGVTYSDTPGDPDWLMKHFMLPVDEGVGRIREEIESLGLAEDTILWFISDNGGTRANGTTSPMTRGTKGSTYEGGHRVPGIVWAPGRITPGTSDALIAGFDIMPTSLNMAGIPVPDGIHFDGIDVGPMLFEGKGLPERTLIWMRISARNGSERTGLRKGPWKLVNDELYNLEADPRESTDLATQYPERLEAMKEEFRAIFNEAVAESPYD